MTNRSLQHIPLSPLHETFFSMALRNPATGCLEWVRSKNRKGYGQIRVDGRLWIAHRLAWELAHGPIPVGVMVLHRCDNPPCVDERHLFLGNNSDNQKDSVAKGRHRMKAHPEEHTLDRNGVHICPRGEQCRSARLTAEVVREIRRLHGEGARQKELAVTFGLGSGHVSRVISRDLWRHVQ